MKTRILSAVLLTLGLQAFAAPVVTTQDVEIKEPKFVQQLRKAYYNSSEVGSNGVMVFSDLLSCSATTCTLLAGKWLMHPEPSFLKNVMYTPHADSAVFDLSEYMQIQPEVKSSQGYETRTKTLETESSGKLYSLVCHSLIRKANSTIEQSQCVLYNGLR